MEAQALATLLVWGCIYILPAAIASHRKHHQTAAITVTNIALGWTFIGWIAALIWASTAVQRSE